MLDQVSNSLGPFPIFQWVWGAAVLLGLVFAVYRGTRDRKLSADQETLPGGVRWYFDGPLNAALQTTRDNYRVLSSIDGHVAPISEEMRRQTELLREMKAEISAVKDAVNRRH